MSHYFQTPSGTDHPRTVQLEVAGRRLELKTGSGVFSRGEIDLGTRVLLTSAPPPPQEGNLLDLGCGYGPLALSMAIRSPRTVVWAVDINPRARELCRENAQAAGITNLRVIAPIEVPSDLQLAAIWSNPPIRIGKEPLHQLLETWLERLLPGGYALLVVQRYLGSDSLQSWLNQQGWPCSRLASKKGFRVLRVLGDSG